MNNPNSGKRGYTSDTVSRYCDFPTDDYKSNLQKKKRKK